MALEFKKPHVIRATYRIVTPMFVGDANHNPADGIRPPAVKGMLRFWWRALNWGRFWKDEDHNEVAALKALYVEEARLFGSSMDESRNISGQGSFLLSVEINKKLETTPKDEIHPKYKDYDAARYLAYGVMEAFGSRNKGLEAAQLSRGCVNEGQCFDLKLVFRNKPDDSVIDALKAFGLLGALGSRSRHGMGCVSLESINAKSGSEVESEIFQAKDSVESYASAVNDILENSNLSTLPPFTSFSRFSRVECLVRGKSPYKVLEAFAEKMLVYRSWGRNGRVANGLQSEQNFEDDHDWCEPDNKLEENFHPRRVVFGLPHNYGKPEYLHIFPENNESGGNTGEGRRASPLFFHIHQLNDTSFIGVAIYLPATFLPADKKISAGGKLVPANIEWEVITNFLDGMNARRYFPNKTVILEGMPHE